MLLQHTSSLRDGIAYPKNYACGDPRVSLATWVQEYFQPSGQYYDAAENFYDYAPGAKHDYTNVTFSLLGHLVERTSGLPFPLYCTRHIFKPLGMENTSWMLNDLDRSDQVIPYTWVKDGQSPGAEWGGVPLYTVRASGPAPLNTLKEGLNRNCLYSHPNYPDGFLRTSALDLSRFAQMHLLGGEWNGESLLQTETLKRMFIAGQNTAGTADTSHLGLVWHILDYQGDATVWTHSGGDPGVRTELFLSFEHDLAVIVFANTYGVDTALLAQKMFNAALKQKGIAPLVFD